MVKIIQNVNNLASSETRLWFKRVYCNIQANKTHIHVYISLQPETDKCDNYAQLRMRKLGVTKQNFTRLMRTFRGGKWGGEEKKNGIIGFPNFSSQSEFTIVAYSYCYELTSRGSGQEGLFNVSGMCRGIVASTKCKDILGTVPLAGARGVKKEVSEVQWSSTTQKVPDPV